MAMQWVKGIKREATGVLNATGISGAQQVS